jgi:hypothetical protein
MGAEPPIASPAEPEASRSPRAGRIRRRLVALVVLAALIGASGVFLDRVVGARAAPGASVRSPTAAGTAFSGAWFCPHGGGQDWKAWIVVANPGDRPVHVRLTSFGASGETGRTDFDLPPHRMAYRAIPATEAGAATEVESFGGWVGASTVVQSASPAGTASERCEAAPSPSWALPDGTTSSGNATQVVVMNPFAQDATFDVTFFTDQRDPVRPGSLTPLVLPAGTSTAIEVRDFVLQAPAEHVVSTAIEVKIGRVVAGSVISTPSGLRSEAGLARPSRHWTVPTAAGGGYVLDLMNRGDHRAAVSIVSQDASGQRVVSGLNDLSVGPGEVTTFELPEATHGGLSVTSTNDVPIDASLVSTNGSGDSAAVSGSSHGARRWLVLPGVPPAGGSGFVALENPRAQTVRVTLRLIDDRGPVASGVLDAVEVPPGATIVVHLAKAVGTSPVAVVVEAQGGTVVAAGASVTSDGAGYSSAPGVPIP